MKLISLNILGGKFYEPLIKFINEHSPTTDIFCFQEVFSSPLSSELRSGGKSDVFEKLSEALSGFTSFFAPEQDGFDFEGPVDYTLSHGQALFVKKNTPVRSEGSIFVHKKRNQAEDALHFPANFEFARLSLLDKELTVCNIHGIPQPGHKLDTSERLEQSKKILEFFGKENGAKIICGDFNLLPGTESVKILENAGFKNLIKEYGIKETRGSLSEYYGRPDHQAFADYVFASPDVKVSSFAVPDAAVSDHMPMILEFALD